MCGRSGCGRVLSCTGSGGYVLNMNYMSSAVKKKRKYEKLSLDQKVQIIRAAEMGYSQRTLASQYNCGKTQIHLLVTQKDIWLAKWERTRKADSLTRSLNSASSLSVINSLVWDFYKKACLHDIITTGQMLQERAQQISNSLNAPNFIASPGWLEKFMEEFDVKLPVVPNRHPPDKVAGADNPLVFKGYDESNVYCFGMIELLYRAMPCMKRKENEHLTVCFSIGALGTKSIESLVFTDNACVEEELWNVNIPCFSSPMGQVTVEVYQHSLNMLNEKMAQENRKVLLYVNETEFPEEIEKMMSNIEIQLWSQEAPYQEIANKFRLLYCQRLLSSLAARSSNWDDIGQLARNLPMWKLMRMVHSAWNQIPTHMLKSIFQADGSFPDITVVSEDVKTNLHEISQLIHRLKSHKIDYPCEEVDYSLLIAEEILGVERDESIILQDDEEKSSMDGASHEPDTVFPFSESEALPTLIQLEMFIQSMSDSPKRQSALELLDKLERTVEDLIIDKRLQEVDNHEVIVP